MPEVEYASASRTVMRKYKENEVNKEMFAEQRDDSIKKQKEENERRRKANALEAAGGSGTRRPSPTDLQRGRARRRRALFASNLLGVSDVWYP
jgi:hypothetical protein